MNVETFVNSFDWHGAQFERRRIEAPVCKLFDNDLQERKHRAASLHSTGSNDCKMKNTSFFSGCLLVCTDDCQPIPSSTEEKICSTILSVIKENILKPNEC